MKSDKRTRWWYRAPGMVYGANFDFKDPVTKREALVHIRQWLKVKRLPNGYEVWA